MLSHFSNLILLSLKFCTQTFSWSSFQLPKVLQTTPATQTNPTSFHQMIIWSFKIYQENTHNSCYIVISTFFTTNSNLYLRYHWLHYYTRFPQRNRVTHKLSKYPRSPSMALLSIQIRPKSLENTILHQNVMPKTYILRFMAYCFSFGVKKVIKTAEQISVKEWARKWVWTAWLNYCTDMICCLMYRLHTNTE